MRTIASFLRYTNNLNFINGPYKSQRFIANSSACTTTELSILLTSCLTAIKKTMSLNIAQQFMKEIVKNYFGLLKIQVKLFIN